MSEGATKNAHAGLDCASGSSQRTRNNSDRAKSQADPSTVPAQAGPPPITANRGLFTSSTPEWATPWDLFRDLERDLGPFDLDVCATPENAKVPRYFTRADDGLAQPWRGRCWMNPPYGREIAAWVKKARESAEAGAVVVCLLPARTDTRWWHDHIEGRARVRFLKGRVRFNGKGPAPFPSAVVVFG